MGLYGDLMVIERHFMAIQWDFIDDLAGFHGIFMVVNRDLTNKDGDIDGNDFLVI